MENLVLNLTSALFFVFLYNLLLFRKENQMLGVRVKMKPELLLFVAIFSLVLFATPAFASATAAAKETGLFTELISKGAEIFNGVRDIVFVVSGFGIIGVAVGGFFGNMNWKWLSAIIIGLIVIGLTGSIIQFVAGDTANVNITNTLI